MALSAIITAGLIVIGLLLRYLLRRYRKYLMGEDQVAGKAWPDGETHGTGAGPGYCSKRAGLATFMSSDNLPEDRIFREEMERNFRKNSDGNWQAPLLFKSHRPRLPNNRSTALAIAKSFNVSSQRNPVKQKHFIDLVQKLFDHKHVEVAPPVHREEEVWYLPVLGVYHLHWQDQIRGVFCQFHGLVTSPNVTGWGRNDDGPDQDSNPRP